MTSGPEMATDAGRTRRRARSQRDIAESLQNRNAIVRSAMEVFALSGYTKTTLQAVAERVGLTRTGLLHHFRSKEGLFVEVIDEGRRWAEQQAKSVPAGRGLDGLRAMRSLMGSMENVTQVQFVQTLQGEALHVDAPDHVVNYVRMRLNIIRNHVTACLEQAHDEGDVGDIDIPAYATLITGLVNGLQAQWLMDHSVDTGAALTALVDLLLQTGSNRA